MRKFITKTLLFLLPVLGFYGTVKLFFDYGTHSDLLRMGYIPYLRFLPHARAQAVDSCTQKNHFQLLSQTKERKFRVMTIGDSFSEQDESGYKNYLACRHSLLHVDRFISQTLNPIQYLVALTNGDFFEKYKVDYVVLQHIERSITLDAAQIDTNLRQSVSDVIQLAALHKAPAEPDYYNLFSRFTLSFPMHMYRAMSGKDYFANNMVYNVASRSDQLFSNRYGRILFYKDDLLGTPSNNADLPRQKLNDVLNWLHARLAQKGVQLIFLAAPDKYDLYYDYIKDTSHLERPRFFERFRDLKKDYLYLDAKAILNPLLRHQQDVYYFSDTHWTPASAKIVADTLDRLISQSPR